MNKVILMGRLTRDPDIRYSSNESQISVARFTLAVDRRFKRDADQTADFISCVAFGRTAEFFRDYIKQGTKICVEGRIQTGSYTRQDGQKVYTTDVVVENAEFAESKTASAGRDFHQQQTGGYHQQSAPAYQQSAPQFQPQQAQAPAYQQNAPLYQAQPQPAPSAPAMDAAGEGFMNIADGLEDEGLPFN